jgi:predicted secreted protein
MIVKGKDVYFLIQNATGDLVPICCARTAALTTIADIAETSTVSTGTWKTFKGMRNSFTLSAGGLVSFDMNYSIAVLRQQQILFAPIQFSFFGIDADGNLERYTGSFLVTSINTPTSFNGNFEYSVEGQGTGALTIEIINDTHLIMDFDSEHVRYD